MNELLGIDMPEFQLEKSRREYLRTYGTLTESIDKAGKKTYSAPIAPSMIVDSDGTMIYLGEGELVRREKGMRAIEQTPRWILQAIMQHAQGSYRLREFSVWPETKWDVDYGIKQVFSLNKVDDDAMPLKLRKALLNYGAPLISRFLIRANPEYAETHFIGIRRRLTKHADRDDDENSQMSIIDLKKDLCGYTLDDYLFPELRELTNDAITAPGGMSAADESSEDWEDDHE